MTNKSNKVLYTGVTNNIARRVYEHREKMVDGLTKKYNDSKLVYCEIFNSPYEAIAAEKIIKGWVRRKKLELIGQQNPLWDDFYEHM